MRDSDKSSVMDDKIVTVQDPIDLTDVSSTYRGKVAFESGEISETDFENLDKNCPTKSFGFDRNNDSISIDHGKCITCGKCSEVSPTLIKIKNSFAPAAKNRTGLVESFDAGSIER